LNKGGGFEWGGKENCSLKSSAVLEGGKNKKKRWIPLFNCKKGKKRLLILSGGKKWAFLFIIQENKTSGGGGKRIFGLLNK